MPNTLAELKKEAEEPHRIAVGKAYQAVYRDILAFVNDCTPAAFGLAGYNNIQSNLYTDIARGEITVTNNNMGDKSVLGHVEVVEIRGGGTEVTIYAVGAMKRGWANLENHVVAKETGC